MLYTCTAIAGAWYRVLTLLHSTGQRPWTVAPRAASSGSDTERRNAGGSACQPGGSTCSKSLQVQKEKGGGRVVGWSGGGMGHLDGLRWAQQVFLRASLWS